MRADSGWFELAFHNSGKENSSGMHAQYFFPVRFEGALGCGHVCTGSSDLLGVQLLRAHESLGPWPAGSSPFLPGDLAELLSQLESSSDVQGVGL